MTCKAIPIKDIQINDDELLRSGIDQESIEELAASIEQVGLLQPITVREGGSKADGSRSYKLVGGWRRVLAHKHLGRETIEATLVRGDNAALFKMRLIENIQRENMNPMDEAEAVAKLKTEHGMKQKEIAECLGKSESWVSHRISVITKLDDDVKRKVRNEEITISQAVEASKIKDEEKKKEATKEKKTTSESRRESRAARGVTSTEDVKIRTREEIQNRLKDIQSQLEQADIPPKDGKEEVIHTLKESELRKKILKARADDLRWALCGIIV